MTQRPRDLRSADHFRHLLGQVLWNDEMSRDLYHGLDNEERLACDDAVRDLHPTDRDYALEEEIILAGGREVA